MTFYNRNTNLSLLFDNLDKIVLICTLCRSHEHNFPESRIGLRRLPCNLLTMENIYQHPPVTSSRKREKIESNSRRLNVVLNGRDSDGLTLLDTYFIH